MADHFAKRRTVTYAGVAAAAVVLISGGVVMSVHGSSSRAAGPTTAATLPPAPMTVSIAAPLEGASGVDGIQPIVLTASAPVANPSRPPTITPPVAGSWAISGATMTFTPSGALAPSTSYRVVVPAGTRSSSGQAVTMTAWTFEFTTASGSTLRLQELLAELGYLPMTWSPAAASTSTSSGAAVFSPPAGTFTWNWAGAPAQLKSQWVAGSPNELTRGAIMAFESDHHLTVDGSAGRDVWAALLSASAAPTSNANKHGYTYALANEGSSPQTLTVWHDGAVVASAPANTGIAQAPTTPGTFPVFERLQNQVMQGTNPDGTKYSDPVAWVAYFDAGQAIHYIPRASYGSFQSLGCVEVSNATGQTVWPYLYIGSLVTVER